MTKKFGCFPRVMASCASRLTPLIERKTPPCKLGLAYDLLTKHVKISHWTRVLLPLGLQQIYLMIKLKGAVNLFADDAERFSWGEIMEGKDSVQYLLQPETGLLSIGAFVQCQKIALEYLKLYASLCPLALAKSFSSSLLLDAFGGAHSTACAKRS